MKQNGIVTTSSFNSLTNFHIIGGTTVDLMHDVLEGHGKVLLAFVIKTLIKRRLITLRELNNAINTFPLTGSEKQLRPSSISDNSLRSGTVQQSAAQVMLLLRLLPLMIYREAFSDEPVWNLFVRFQSILDLLLSPKIKKSAIQTLGNDHFILLIFKLKILERLIEEHLKDYIEHGGHMITKSHYLLHYPRAIQLMGPCRHVWSMRYEGKHFPLKQYANSTRNFINMPLSLSIKHQISTAKLLSKFKNSAYLIVFIGQQFISTFEVRIGNHLLLNFVRRTPTFGQITRINGSRLHGNLLEIIRFDEDVHCFVVKTSSRSFECDISELEFEQHVHVYKEAFIRLPFICKV